MSRKYALLVVAGSVLGLAADFWNEKPVSDWSEKDAHRLLDRSPWMRSSTVEMETSGGMQMGGRGGGRRGGGAPSMSASTGSSGMEGGGGEGGFSGRGDGRPPSAQATVRWESAKPLQEASQMLEAPLAKQIGKLSERFYVISLVGMPLMIGGRGPGSDTVSPEDRMKALQQRLQKSAALKRKDKPDILAEQVGMVQAKKGPMLVFLFPRAAGIALEDKDITFECSAGPARVRSKFALKDMVYKGDLTL